VPKILVAEFWANGYLSGMTLEKLYPNIPGLAHQGTTYEEDFIFVNFSICLESVLCPNCRAACSRVHSRYKRCFADLPWAGYQVKIILLARKFFCDNIDCERKIFTERLGNEVKPYARKTLRLDNKMVSIGFATGGNAGAKLCKTLGMSTSPSTVLRLLHASPTTVYETPRVLGIDDWAFRKGHNYGTILIDLEKRKPIDLLPDREVETVKAWLESHPGVEIISRDRASCYSKAAEQGAPQAIQVADRWHLLKNLGDALKRMLDNHNKEIRLAAKEIAIKERELEEKSAVKLEVENEEKKNNLPAENKKQTRYELNFLEVKRLQKAGCSIRSIHRQTGVHRQTIKRYLKYDIYPEKDSIGYKPSSALPFEGYLRKRWSEGETRHMQLWREVKEQGYTGSPSSIYRLVCKYPKDTTLKDLPTPLKIKVWSARKVCMLLNKPFESLNEEKQNFLRVFYKLCPSANIASQLARKFKEMTDKLRRKKLDGWIESAKESNIPALKNFARGLLQDYDAVKAAVSLKWSNGQVEGQVNRLKNIKRQMYGRGSLELLRKRVLADSN